MNILYYLGAIGRPNINEKIKILENNIKIINKNIDKFSILINDYTGIEEQIKKVLNKFKCIEKIYYNNKKGVLCELWINNPFNLKIHQYDYILLTLDDVEFKNIDINDMIKIKEKFNIDILSPKIINATHQFMFNQQKNILTINNFNEMYFYLMTPKDFFYYLSINTIENKWLWGVDFMFNYFKIKTGVIFKYEALHKLKFKNDNTEARHLMKKYLKNFGENDTEEIKKKIPAVKNIIKI